MNEIIRMLHWSECWPPHDVVRPEQVEELAEMFERAGWGKGEDVLIGYPFEGGIQLLTGSHRWAAAVKTDTVIPVMVYDASEIEQAWGTDRWQQHMKRIPIYGRNGNGR